MTSAHYDVLIIGAGIHGAGVAQAAAAAHYTVLVLDKGGIAGGTSSRSSKLIHGGLRYLESGQLSLVRQCLRERTLLLHNAPHLVKPVPFFIPIYRHTRRRPWQIRLGLSVYALLTGLGDLARFNRLTASRWPELDGLLTRDLQAVFQYWDAQTDDAALTRAVLASARELGAEVQLNTEVTDIAVESDCCRVSCQTQTHASSYTAGVVINAAGPWVNQVLSRVAPAERLLEIDLVAGTHIVLDYALHQGIYYTESPADGRAVFIMPWQGKTLVGTTEKLFSGDPDTLQPSQAEIDYLLKCFAHYFPEAKSPAIVESFAGLRVLAKTDSNPFHRPRDTILHVSHHNRVLSIYGGKLTAYRATAEKALRRIAPSLPKKPAQPGTDILKLP